MPVTTPAEPIEIPDSTTDVDIYEPSELTWKDRVAANPGAGVALAFGAGAVAAMLLRSKKNNGGGYDEPETPLKKSKLWAGIKTAVISLAARKAFLYAQRRFNIPRVI